MGGDSRRSTPISAIGIPTADRPDIIGTAIADALDHVGRRGSPVRTFVLDGSRSADHQQQTRHRVESKSGGRVAYVGPSQRAAGVARLARAGFSREMLESAVGRGSIGSQRNLLLLLGAGRGVLMTDDDVRWTTWRPPTYEPGLRLAGHSEPRAHRFFGTREEAVEGCDQQTADLDLLTLHEHLLGRAVGDLLDDQTDFSSACPHLLALLDDSRPLVVRVTMAGLAGDSGTYCPYLRLFADGEVRATLSRSQEAFDLALSSREIQRVASRTTVTHDPRCMAGCMAVDNTDLLPPFMWHGSNEDGLFGVMLAASDRSALFGHLACGVVHDSDRPSARDAGPILSATQTRLADLLLVIARRASQRAIPDIRTGLASLGRLCCEATDQPPGEFQGFARDVLLDARGRQLLRLSHIAEDQTYPPYWREAATRFRDECLDSMKDVSFFCPVEFKRANETTDGCLARVQSAIRRFGELLQTWPDLWDSARQIGTDGLLSS